MSLINTIIAGASQSSTATTVTPEGTEFDGATDNLSRATALSGAINTDYAEISFFGYLPIDSIGNPGLGQFQVGGVTMYDSGGQYRVIAQHTGGQQVSYWRISSNIGIQDFINQWAHYYIRVEPTEIYFKINGIPITRASASSAGSATKINNSYYTSQFIAKSTSNYQDQMRISNFVYITTDTTYLDIPAFITADGKPTPMVTLKALNPILYLPMTSASTAHVNEGTGGNFVQNGTLDTASRGANQDNCVASYFDGSADYLSRASLTGATSTKTFTISFNFKYKYNSDDRLISFITSSPDTTFQINCLTASSIQVICIDRVSVGYAFSFVLGNIIDGANYSLHLSGDINTQSSFKLIINGVNTTISFSNFDSSKSMTLNSVTNYLIATQTISANFYNGNIGELYFDTRYTDLSTSNPFWDSTAKRPKPVRQVISETGITPLIAMPLDASNAGKNYGTGGDFTANSAPYVGARGGSEFWARSIKYDSSSNYLSLSSSGDTQTLSCAFAFKISSADNGTRIFSFFNGGTETLYIRPEVNQIRIYGSGINMLSSVLTYGIWYVALLCIDKSNSSKRYLYLNGNVDAPTWTTYDTSNLPLGNTIKILSTTGTTGTQIGFNYLSKTYIDFSQETNRNLFVDQMGYPKDLKAQIDAGVIPNPLIYLPFDDSTNLGKNLGTGGDFVVNGSVLPSSDVLG